MSDDVDFDREFEAHWHDDGGVTLSHRNETHTFEARDSALAVRPRRRAIVAVRAGHEGAHGGW